MKLPLLLSVPHAGLTVPGEVASICILTPDQVRDDGDVGAREIYDFENEMEAFVSTEIARAIVDQNRQEDDFTKDGVIKTHTCWNVPVYREFPGPDLVEHLLERYHRPYHRLLESLARTREVMLGIDCHTMAAVAPPIGPDEGERPAVCLGYADGTCPREWIEHMADCFREAYEREVTINVPFSGGFITRSRPGHLPWIQLELSRAPFFSLEDKRLRVWNALRRWCETIP